GPPVTSSIIPVPAPDPVFAPILAQAWMDQQVSEDPKEHAYPGTLIRHSYAAVCARRLAYEPAGVEPTDPPDLTAYCNFDTGRIPHEQWQEVAQKLWPGARAEVRVRPPGRGDLSSGHVDLTVDDGPMPGRATVEVKTVGGFGFKKAIGFSGGRGFDGRPEGPKWSWLVQGSVNAYCQEADVLVIVALAKEAISVSGAKRDGLPDWARICAEWRYPPEVFRPIAEAELERWQRIVDVVGRRGVLAVPREVPDGPGRVVSIADPRSGRTTQGRSFWACSYCPFQQRCVEDAR